MMLLGLSNSHVLLYYHWSLLACSQNIPLLHIPVYNILNILISSRHIPWGQLGYIYSILAHFFENIGKYRHAALKYQLRLKRYGVVCPNVRTATSFGPGCIAGI